MNKEEYQIISRSPEETRCFGAFLGRHATSGLVIALKGELGSGKTCLTQGLAQGLEVPGDLYVTSPTYTLVNEYPGRIDLIHVDLYRIEGRADLEDLGVEEMMGSHNVVVVEWADKVSESLPQERLSVVIDVLDHETRKLQLTGYGHRAGNLVRRCLAEFNLEVAGVVSQE